MRERARMFWLLGVLVLVMAALSATVVQAGAAASVGSRQRPVQLYFVPSVDVAVIQSAAEKMVRFLQGQTGLFFQTYVPTSYAAVIEAMGAAEGDTMGFIPALAYALANQKYGVEVALATVRRGRSWYATAFFVRRDSGIRDMAGLSGKVWAMPDPSSTSGYLYPKALMIREGIRPSRELMAGGHPQAILAVYEGSADFATAFFSPPDPPKGSGLAPWQWGMDPEHGIWDRSANRRVTGSQAWEVLDARSLLVQTIPDIVDKVGIVGLSDRIPNDTVSFVRDFPGELRERIVQGLLDFAATPEGQAVLGDKRFYAIDGFERVDDTFYQPVRDLIRYIGLTERDILR